MSSSRILEKEKTEIAKGFRYEKGAIQLDFVIATGLFLIIFAYIVVSFNSFIAPIRAVVDTAQLRSEAESLRSLADFEYVPQNWPPPFMDGDTLFLLRFDNSTNDSSTRRNDGLGAAGSGIDCRPNVQGMILSACRFDGINDAVNVSDDAETSVSGSFTIEAWIWREPGTARNSTVVSKFEAGGNQRSYALYINNESKADFRISTDGSAVMNVIGNTTLATGVWYHLAGVFAANTTLEIYVNAMQENRNASSVPSTIADTTVATTIGGRSGAAESFFNGTIDEVRLTNRSLNESVIKEHYEFGKKLRRLGMNTRAYRVLALINNTAAHQRFPADPVRNITNEQVVFNITHLADNYDLNSVAIYDEFNTSVPYQRAGHNFTFIVNINISQERWYTIYFDDDSRRFMEPSNTVSGVDNLTEVFLTERINVIQYDKIAQLNLTNLSDVRQGMGMEGFFRLKLTDIDLKKNILDAGDIVPKTGTVVSLQRYVLFQNSTAGIRTGRLTVQVW